MDINELQKIKGELFTEISNILQKRNSEYAYKNDVFKCFDLTAVSMDKSIFDVFKTLINIKIQRINTASEEDLQKIKDSIFDLMGYCVLLYAYIEGGNDD